MRLALFCLCLVIVSTPASEPFVIKADDRVVLVGDTLFEREGVAAALETRLYQQFAPSVFTVRNLSFAADRPDGVSRASFDPPEAGKKRLAEQLAMVKPTVAIIGYGMAASLEELTYRSGDASLNPDPDRYGTDFTAERFGRDLEGLIEMIKAAAGGPVRLVFVAPLRHEDLRTKRPLLPDPSAHEALLSHYRTVIKTVAEKHQARYVDTPNKSQDITWNGIHPTAAGLEVWADAVAKNLGWQDASKIPADKVPALRAALQRRNDLFFHRWRPANFTYIFGFRKREQGKNAAEMPIFDDLIAKADQVIADVVAGKTPQVLPIKPAIPPAETPAPDPGLTVDPTLEVNLFAANPLISKPLHLAFDARGHMWVASTPIYPMIEPGAVASDRIFIVKDTNKDGVADTSSLFANDLLIPTGVAPIERVDGKLACYVGASTDLLMLTDTDGDGKADERRTVLSGFGTEDTHHTVHTLYWGHDGRLYFNQSVYIHSHLETPYGVVRLNAGGVFAYDPASERTEVFIKGLWNTWGHAMNADGQSFFTDGAGGTGISWGFPGSVFKPSEGAKHTMPGISPGSYPKFCGLEIIDSPLFPDDWLGHAITCDFRAHRMVRFNFIDYAPKRAGFITDAQPDLLRTGDAWFRPIDVKHGPDGALYVADWTNPVINHGEVDFRDPRRDKEHGRIWRIVPKGKSGLPWTPVADRDEASLFQALLSPNTWERDLARRTLVARCDDAIAQQLTTWVTKTGTPAARREAASVLRGANRTAAALAMLDQTDAGQRALAARWSDDLNDPKRDERLAILCRDEDARVRVEAMRALARLPSLAITTGILQAIAKQPADDPYYAFATTITLRSVAKPWVESLAAGDGQLGDDRDAVAAGLLALNSKDAAPAVKTILNRQEHLTVEPWTALVGHAGDENAVAKLYAALPSVTNADRLAAGLQACVSAAERRIKAPSDLATLASFLLHESIAVQKAAITLAGSWRQNNLVDEIGGLAKRAELRSEALGALTQFGKEAVPIFKQLLMDKSVPAPTVVGALAKVDRDAALASVQPLLAAAADEQQAAALWRMLWPAPGMMAHVEKNGLPAGLSAVAIKGGLTTARELGRKGKKLEELFKKASPTEPVVVQADRPADLKGWMALVQRAGDPVKGERLYFGGSVACIQCHAIGGVGGQLGPDMSTLGASAPLDYIIESVENPAAKVKEGYHAVSFRLKDGSTVMGIPASEDDSSFVVRLPGMEQRVAKDQIVARDTMGSLMPPGMLGVLPVADQAHVYAFLAQLGKPGAFDASDGRVARSFIVLRDQPSDKLTDLSGKPSVMSLVDGRVVPAAWRTVASAANDDGTCYAVAVVEVGKDSTLTIQLEGSERPWLDGIRFDPQETSRKVTAGRHIIGVRVNVKKPPGVLRLRVDQGRFVQP